MQSHQKVHCSMDIMTSHFMRQFILSECPKTQSFPTENNVFYILLTLSHKHLLNSTATHWIMFHKSVKL